MTSPEQLRRWVSMHGDLPAGQTAEKLLTAIYALEDILTECRQARAFMATDDKGAALECLRDIEECVRTTLQKIRRE